MSSHISIGELRLNALYNIFLLAKMSCRMRQSMVWQLSKKCAAIMNSFYGKISKEKADLIINAAAEVIVGKLGYLTAEEYDTIVKPNVMVHPSENR
jgi:fumarate hydratase class II